MASLPRATDTAANVTVRFDLDDPAVAVPFVDPPPAAIPDSSDSADPDADWLYFVDWPVAAAAAATRQTGQHEPARVDPIEPTEDATPIVIDALAVTAVEPMTAIVVAADCQHQAATVVAVVDRPVATSAAPAAEVDFAIDAIAASERAVAVAVC